LEKKCSINSGNIGFIFLS